LGGVSRRFNELRWHTACIDRMGARSEWTLIIEKDFQVGKTTTRLIGHFQPEQVGELKKQLQDISKT
jgi:hypothetical protein